MIVVKIELHSAITKKITTLGTMIIDNIGGTNERRNYRVRVGNKKDVGNLSAIQTKPLRTGEVSNYPSLAYNVWRLVSRALLSAFPEEKIK